MSIDASSTSGYPKFSPRVIQREASDQTYLRDPRLSSLSQPASPAMFHSHHPHAGVIHAHTSSGDFSHTDPINLHRSMSSHSLSSYKSYGAPVNGLNSSGPATERSSTTTQRFLPHPSDPTITQATVLSTGLPLSEPNSPLDYHEPEPDQISEYSHNPFQDKGGDEFSAHGGLDGHDEKSMLPSQRRATILREQQKVLHANEKEEAHWAKQDQRFKKMIDRLNTGAKTCEELYHFLQRSSKVMSGFAQAMLDQGSFGSRETGTLRQACIAQEVYGHSIFEHYGEMKERVFQESVKQALLLTQTMKKRVYSMQELGGKQAKAVKMHREKVAEAWTTYEKAFMERQRLEMSNKPVRQDPFLACRVYEREVADMRAAEKEYSKEMSKLFMELRIDDGRRIDAIKTIMLDYLLAQKALLEHTVKFTESVIASVKGIDREADVSEFVAHADLLLNVQRSDGTPSALSTTIFELPPPNRDPHMMTRLYSQEVEKEGHMCRQGKVFKSNWKDIQVAVSTSGFLHYFDDPKVSTPDFTLALAACTVKPAPQTHKCAFEVHEPNKSFFNFSGSPTVYCFKADTEEEMEQWIAAIQKYTERTFAATVSSADGVGAMAGDAQSEIKVDAPSPTDSNPGPNVASPNAYSSPSLPPPPPSHPPPAHLLAASVEAHQPMPPDSPSHARSGGTIPDSPAVLPASPLR